MKDFIRKNSGSIQAGLVFVLFGSLAVVHPGLAVAAGCAWAIDEVDNL